MRAKEAPAECPLPAVLPLRLRPTPFGNLLLDGATAFVAISSVAGTDQRADSNLAVPVSPSFLGLRLPVHLIDAATVQREQRLGGKQRVLPDKYALLNNWCRLTALAAAAR